jgi:chemotaxis protein MotB
MKKVTDNPIIPDIPRYKKMVNDSNPADDADSNWMITLSDVLTLLLVFFIMFSVMNKSAKSDTIPQTDNRVNIPFDTAIVKNTPSSDTLSGMKNEMDSAIRDLNMEEGIDVQTLDKEIVITMRENVTFMSADAELLNDSEPVLDKIASIIKSHPSFIVEIDGHTDNVPINTPRYPSNWELSVARAASVLKYLINHHGMEPSRFSIKGDADQRPLASNDTTEHRALNRRVEIRLKEQETTG